MAGDPSKWRVLRDFMTEHDSPFGILLDNALSPRRLDDLLIALPPECL